MAVKSTLEKVKSDFFAQADILNNFIKKMQNSLVIRSQPPTFAGNLK